jgi:hypothetical protein
LVLIPGVDLLAGFIFGDSISLLNYPLELLLAAIDLCEVVIGQFPPLLLLSKSKPLSRRSTHIQVQADNRAAEAAGLAWLRAAT